MSTLQHRRHDRQTLRMARPFDPFDYGRPVLVLESERITGVAATDPIDTFADYSGDANHATAESAARPLYYPSLAQHGYPAALFAGSQRLYLTSALNLANFTIAAVSLGTFPVSNYPLIGHTTSASSYIVFGTSTLTHFYAGTGGQFTHASRTPGGVYVDVFHRDGGDTVRHWLNGALSSGPLTDAGTLAPDQVGAVQSVIFARLGLYALYIWPHAVTHVAGTDDWPTSLTTALLRKYALL